MFAICVPLILIILSLLLVFLIIRGKNSIAGLVFITIIIFNLLYKSFPINFLVSTDKEIDFSLFCLNIHARGTYLRSNYTNPEELTELLLSKNTDALILLEYDTILCRNLKLQLEKEYPYFDFTYELPHIGPNAIFSKYPLSKRKVVRFDGRRNEELKTLLMSTKGRGVGLTRLILEEIITVKGKEVCLISCHLESNHIDITNDEHENKSVISRLFLHFSNIIRSSKVRQLEALEIVKDINFKSLSNLPIIVCGDMNALSGSTTMSILENCGLHDAWWDGGCGYGSTYRRYLSFRIDHVLYNKKFELVDIEVINSGYLSDHKGVYAAFKFSS